MNYKLSMIATNKVQQQISVLLNLMYVYYNNRVLS